MAIAQPSFDPTTGRPVYSPDVGKPAKDCDAESCPASVTVTLSGWTTGTFEPCLSADNLNAGHAVNQSAPPCSGARCAGNDGACCYQWNGNVYDSPEMIEVCYDTVAQKWYLWITDSCCLDIKAEMASANQYAPAGAYSVTSTTCITTTGTVVIS